MEDQLLNDILTRYRTSRDFNGLYFEGKIKTERDAAVSLVRRGLIQVVSEDDYPNPHIRPWQSRRSEYQQIKSITELTPESYGVCLYPTPTALKRPGARKRYIAEPYNQAMSKGRGTLELAYFQFDVLEQYRNDPRFTFEFGDFGARTIISDNADMDENEPEHDKIIMDHIGFAYDLSRYKRDDPSSPIIRRVCAFYGDLRKLSAVHQQRWKTYQVPDEEALRPHPVWWGTQMGHWPDGRGPFQAIFLEMEYLNDLHESAFGEKLFKTIERPSDFGWILRASQHEWDAFVHQLDKLLSENIRHEALDAASAPRQENGANLGTVARLARLLAKTGVSLADVKIAVQALNDVRLARQRPAHILRANIADGTFVHKQIVLLEQVVDCLYQLRKFWETHPKNKGWKPRYTELERSYRM